MSDEPEENIDFDDCTPVDHAPVAEPETAPNMSSRKRRSMVSVVPTSSRVQPHSLEAEAGLLSCLTLSDGADTIARCLEARFTPKYFYVPANQIIFGQLADMHARGVPLDFAALAVELRSAGKLEDVGGMRYLVEVSQGQPTSFMAAYYIEKVADLHARRELIKTMSLALESCFESADEAAEIMLAVRDRIDAVQSGVSIVGGLRDRIEKRRFSNDEHPVEPVPRFLINGKPVSTPGNLTNLIAQAKAGKSAEVGAMIAAAICSEFEGGEKRDTLNVSASAPGGRILLHIDTEQSPYDHDQLVMRSLRRAGVAKAPAWLWSYGMAGFSATELREALRIKLADARRQKKMIFAVILDGTADLVNDVNDPEECNAFVAELHGLAIEYHCPIINVVHENPGQQANGKMRGHLGSQLERKAESNITLKKTEDVTVVFSEKMRRAPILEKEGPRFRWSDKEGMHTSLSVSETQSNTPSGRGRPKSEYTFADFADIFPTDPAKGLGFRALHRAANTSRPVSQTSFWRIVEEALSLGLVAKVVGDDGKARHYKTEKSTEKRP